MKRSLKESQAKISVGRLENAYVAESVIRNNQVDLVAIGKGLLKNPYWVKEASLLLGEEYELPGVYNLGF
jgi:NADPH2 dehydrogenase